MAQDRNETLEEVDARADALRDEDIAAGATADEVNTLDTRHREPTSDIVIAAAEEANMPVSGIEGDLEAAGKGITDQVTGESTLAPEESELKELQAMATQMPEATASDGYIKDKAEEAILISGDIDADVDETTQDEIIRNLRSAPTIEEGIRAHTKSYGDAITAVHRKSLAGLAVSAGDSPENRKVYADVLRGIDQNQAKYSLPDAPSKIIVEKFKDVTLDQAIAADEEAQHYVMSYYKKGLDEKNVFEKVIDGLGVVFDPFWAGIDGRDMINMVSPDVSGFNPNNMVKILEGFHSLSSEGKKIMGPKLIDAAWKAYGDNGYKVGMFASAMFDMDAAKELYIGIGIETAASAFPLYKGLKALKNSVDISSMLMKLGNAKEAYKISKRTKTPVAQAHDANPVNMDDSVVDMGKTQGLAPEHQKNIAEQNAKFKRIEDETQEIPALSRDDQQAAIDNRLAALNGENFGDGYVANAKLLDRDDKGFSIIYDIVDDTGLLHMKKNVLFTKADAGVVSGKIIDQKAGFAVKQLPFLATPHALLRNINKKLADNVTFGNQQASKAIKNLTKVWDDLTGSVSKSDNEVVDALIRTGDEWSEGGKHTGKVFTREELAAGTIETKKGYIEYTPAQIDHYELRRNFSDNLHKVAGERLGNDLRFQGYMEGYWKNPKTGEDEVALVTPFKDGKGFNPEKTETILAPGLKPDGESQLIAYNHVDLKEVLAMGYKPVTLAKPIKIGDTLVTKALLPPNSKGSGVRDVPRNPLHKSVGYETDIRQPNLVYIKDLARGETRTVARAANRTEAEAYIKETMARQELDNVPAGERVSLAMLDDRDYNALSSVQDGAEAFGGLVYGSRSSRQILNVGSLKGVDSRLNAMQTTQKIIESIANNMPMNEYKMASISTWKERVKAGLKANNVPDDNPIYRKLSNEREWVDLDLGAIGSKALQANLKAERDYLVKQFSIQSKDEKIWKKKVNNMAEEYFGAGPVQRFLKRRAENNPVTGLKKAVFHPTFGYFNIFQYPMQLMNISTTVAMHPLHAATAIPKSYAQKWFLDVDVVDEALVRQVSKGVVPDDTHIGDMIESLAQFKKSGIREDLLRNNADQGAIKAGFTTGTKKAWEKFQRAGLAPFEQGNNDALLIAWNIHRDIWKKANPGKAIDDKVIRELSAEAHRTNMGMQASMAGKWQDNTITSLPGMFVQPFAKLTENMVGAAVGGRKTSNWSRKEALSVLAGMTVMFGTNDVPITESIGNAIQQGISGTELEFAIENPQTNAFIEGGMSKFITENLGLHNDFNSRFNLFSGFKDIAVLNFAVSMAGYLTGEENSVEMTFPAKTRIERGYNVLESLYDGAHDLLIAPSLETLGNAAFHSFDVFLTQASSWSNARKLLFADSLGGLVNKKGEVTIGSDELFELPWQTIAAKGMGVSLDKETEMYAKIMADYSDVKKERDTFDSLRQIWNIRAIDGNEEKFKAHQSLLLNIYKDEPAKRRKLLSKFIQHVSTSKSKKDKVVAKLMAERFRTGGKSGDGNYADLIESTNEIKDNN